MPILTTHKSILHPDINGVQKISGYRGNGKSYYASQVENPKLTVFWDFEKKGEGINSQLGFGLYSPVTEKSKGGGIAVWETFALEVQALPEGRFTHAILDNTAPLEMGMKAEAARNAETYARQFGMDASNIRGNKYGGQGGVVNYMVSERICNVLWGKGIRLITVTSHVKPRWVGGAQVANSFNIKGADRWDELSILTLILIPGDKPPIPSALVMKEQLGEIRFNDETGEFTPSRRLPARLPVATPKKVTDYLNNPADLENPAPGEVPTPAEYKPFSETLDKEQMSLVLAEVRRNEQERKEEKVLASLPPLEERVVELLAFGDDPKLIRQSLNEQGYKITPPELNKLIAKLKENT